MTDAVMDEVQDREYRVLKFSPSLGVCLPPEFSRIHNLRNTPLFCFATNGTLIYRPVNKGKKGERYIGFFKPVYRQKHDTSVIVLPPEWREIHVEAGDTLICSWDEAQVRYKKG
tara:strand:- start:8 stop:349 length:342 start_codon:yes stop_codon:yes gene_type:complete